MTVQLFQSGDAAAVNGIYHLVRGNAARETSELTVRAMKQGEILPFHEGKSAGWVLIQELTDDELQQERGTATSGR